MGKNMQRLGATLANRMKQTSNAAIPTTIELGKVNGNLSITTDSLKTPIPKGDYMVNLMLSGSCETEAASHDSGTHKHKLRGIKPGDRILVAWCGNEPVVLAVVVSS